MSAITPLEGAAEEEVVTRLRALLRSHPLTAVLVFVVCFTVYAITAPHYLVNADALSASVEGWHIAVHDSPWLDDVDFTKIVTSVAGSHQVLAPWVAPGPGGHLVSYRSPGVVAAAVPAYWINAHVFGHSGYSFKPGDYAAAAMAAAAVALTYLTITRFLRRPVALLTIFVLAFATPMWTAAATFLWTHPITVLGVAGMAWAASRDRWWLAGIFGGIGLWGRFHVSLIVGILGLGMALWRRDWRIAAKVGVPSLAMTALAGLWSHWLYGDWSPTGGYSASAVSGALVTGNTNDSPVIGGGLIAKVMNQVGLWIAPDRGILVFTPVLLVLLPLVVRHWRELPDWSRVLLLGGVAYALAQGQIDGFTGGDGFFGYRLMLEPLMCAVPAFAFSLRFVPRWLDWLLAVLVSIMWGAFAYAAYADVLSVGTRDTLVHPAAYLPKEVAWRQNALLENLAHGKPIGWVLILLPLMASYYVVRGWRARAARAVQPGREPATAPVGVTP